MVKLGRWEGGGRPGEGGGSGPVRRDPARRTAGFYAEGAEDRGAAWLARGVRRNGAGAGSPGLNRRTRPIAGPPAVLPVGIGRLSVLSK